MAIIVFVYKSDVDWSNVSRQNNMDLDRLDLDRAFIYSFELPVPLVSGGYIKIRYLVLVMLARLCGKEVIFHVVFATKRSTAMFIALVIHVMVVQPIERRRLDIGKKQIELHWKHPAIFVQQPNLKK